MQVVWVHCRDRVRNCGSAFFALACKPPKEYLAALHTRSAETHAADNAFVAGMEEPRVPPQHAGLGGMDMQREAGYGEDGGGAWTGHVVHSLVRDVSTQSMAGSPARIPPSMTMCHRGPLLKICI